MINVSAALMEAFNPNSGLGPREIEWEATYELIDENAQANRFVRCDTQDVRLSRISQTADNVSEFDDYISFEFLNWRLDGSQVVPSRPGESPTSQIGLVCDGYSDAAGFFRDERKPVISLDFDGRRYDLIAVTIDCGHSPIGDLRVDWYTEGPATSDSMTISGNRDRVILVNHAVWNVSKVVITVLRTATPHHEVRIVELIAGAKVIFSRSNANTLIIREGADFFSKRVIGKTLKIVVDNFARDFDIFDPTGIYAFFRVRQRISVRIGAKTASGIFEYVPMGSYYIDKPKLKGNLSLLEFYGVDDIGLLKDANYSAGAPTLTTNTLSAFAKTVADDANLKIAWTGSAGSTVSAYLRSEPHTELFAKLAAADCRIIATSRTSPGTVQFLEITGAVVQTISATDYRMDNGILPEDCTEANTLDLSIYQIALNTGEEELARLKNASGVMNAGFYIDHCHIDTVDVMDAYTLDYDPSTAMHLQMVSGDLVVLGRKYLEQVKTKRYANGRPDDALLITDEKDNIFIQAANADKVGAFVLDHKSHKTRLVKINYRGYPYFEIGDVIRFETELGTTQAFVITNLGFDLTDGGMTGTLEAYEQ